jgi:hypothetical protein
MASLDEYMQAKVSPYIGILTRDFYVMDFAVLEFSEILAQHPQWLSTRLGG